jgi:hypothetical protein
VRTTFISALAAVFVLPQCFAACAESGRLESFTEGGLDGALDGALGGDVTESGADRASGGAAGSSDDAGDGSGGADGDSGPTLDGCVTGENTDGDGMDDCAELGDGDPWTDPLVFNGVHVRQADQCSGSAGCNENTTGADIDACMAGADFREELDQYAGWDFFYQPNDVCSPGYGFLPNWTACDERWQAEWKGFVNLASAGNHCFAVIGNTDEQCGSLLFDQETTALQTGAPAACHDVAAAVYPIRWHYNMDNSSADDNSLTIAYCFGGAGPCTPSSALPASMLRPTYP